MGHISALLPNTFANHYPRQDVSAVHAETRSYQYDGPFNSHSASLGSTLASCLEDDENFVRSEGKHHRRRLVFLWNIVLRRCADQYDIALQTWLKLLEGSTIDDVWLWVDGDEKIARSFWLSEPNPTDWRKAASALSRRLKQVRIQEESVHLADRRRRVQDAEPDARFSMIAWLVVSSETFRAIDTSRGVSRRDLMSLIAIWYGSSLGYSFSFSNDAFQTFCEAMTTEGHSCHHPHIRYPLERWILMRSLLNPSQCYDVVSLSPSSCQACDTHTQLLARSPSASASSSSVEVLDATNSVHYRPPHHLVFLWILWSQINGTSEYSKWLKCLDQMVCQESSPLLNVSTLKSVDSWLSKIRGEQLLPWVNFYPQFWRTSLQALSSHDWERAENSIWPAATTRTLQKFEQSSSDICDLPTSSDIRTWIGAVFMLMSTNGPENNLDPLRSLHDFISIVDNNTMKRLFQSVPPLPEVEPTTTVINFRRTVQDSYHSCYKKYGPASLDWYASAVALATGSDHTGIIPFVGDDSCVWCRITKIFCDPVRCERLSSSAEGQQKLTAVLQELVEIKAQEGLRLALPMSDSRLDEPSSTIGEHSAKPEIGTPSRSDTGASNIVHSSNRITNGTHDPERTEINSSSERTRNDSVVLEPKAPRRSKGFMIKEIKVHFIKLLDALGVPILGLKTKQLPWTTLRALLAERGWELDNWPHSVPLPGSGDQACDDNKGINGLDMKYLHLLYDAMKSKTSPLGFRRIVSTATSAAADSSQVPGGHCATVVANDVILKSNISRKRLCDARIGGDSQPGKRPRMSEM